MRQVERSRRVSGAEGAAVENRRVSKERRQRGRKEEEGREEEKEEDNQSVKLKTRTEGEGLVRLNSSLAYLVLLNRKIFIGTETT